MVWETVPSINHCDTHGKGRVSRGSATPHPKGVALQRPQKCWDPLHAPTWYVPYVKQQTRYCMMKLMKPCPSQEFLWSTLTHYLFVVVDILVCSVWTSLYKVISCLWDNICRRWKTSFCVLFCNAELQISDISPAIWTCALPLVQLITRQQSISQNTWVLQAMKWNCVYDECCISEADYYASRVFGIQYTLKTVCNVQHIKVNFWSTWFQYAGYWIWLNTAVLWRISSTIAGCYRI